MTTPTDDLAQALRTIRKAIDAALSRAAEPVNVPVGWAKEYGRETLVSWSKEAPEHGKGGWTPLYTHSPETARDAARYRFWRKHYSAKIALVAPSGVAYFPRSRPPAEPLGENYEAKIDAAIDAAMAQESGDAT